MTLDAHQQFIAAENRKWVGDLPDGWTLVRNQGLFDETKIIGFPDEELLSVTIQRGIIPQTDITTKKDSSNDDKSKYKLLEPGDLAYNKMRMWQGAIGRSELRGIVSPAYVTLRPRHPEYSRFFHYLYRTHRFITEANRNSYGLCDDMNSLRYEHFKTIHTPVPPEDTMHRIVSFLDEKTAEIDAAIEKKRRLIDLLNEQKAILINRAVTKGLNPDAPMKDSGVDWIGEIPAHWEVKRLKFLLRQPLKYGANEEASESVAGDPRYIRITDFGFDGQLRDDTVRTLPMKKASEYMLDSGDILFARSGATVGKTFQFSGAEAACFAGYLIRARADTRQISSDYLYLYTKSAVFDRWKEAIFSKSTIQNIGADKYAVLFVIVPPLAEQADLLKQLSEDIAPIDAVVSITRNEISFLNEFKQTLIANAVTGKIKI